MRFFFKTFGCRLNSLDSARLERALTQARHELTTWARADWVILNSCVVTQTAERKLTRALRQAFKQAKQVGVLGCAARLNFAQIKRDFPQAAIFQTEKDFRQYFGLTQDFNLPAKFRTRLPVMVTTGCSGGCTFCATKLARGKLRSLSEAEIFAQISNAERLQLKEIVLTGVNLGAFGMTGSKQSSQLPVLLTKILHRSKIPRIRLSSLGPEFLTPDFFQVFRNPRICDFLHLAIQAGSNKILRLMGRNYRVAKVRKVVRLARLARPNVAITADLMVGFPGESRADLQATKDLMTELKLAKVHVFPFSVRPGTPAASFALQIPVQEKGRRAREVRALGESLRQKFIASQVGKNLEVLVEKGGVGLSKNYLRVRVSEGRAAEIYKVQLRQGLVAN